VCTAEWGHRHAGLAHLQEWFSPRHIHNPFDVVGGAAVGRAIAAALDLLLDVARDRAGRRPEASTS
jgi:hypothetical protein